MRYPVFLATTVFLVIVQTALVPELSDSYRLFDLIIPLAIYFSLFRPFLDGLPILLAAGIMMDMVSGAPIGIYLTAYLWLFVAFRQTRRWVRIKQSILFQIIVILGVLFENALFWIAISTQSGRFVFSPKAVQLVFFQILWTVIAAPILLMMFHAIFHAADRLGEGSMRENGKPKAP